jgi:hypothetical protein
MDTTQTTPQVETIQQSLAQKSTEILDWLETSIKQTSNFVAEQTPQFIQELLQWNFYSSLAGFLCGFVMLGIVGYYLYLLLHIDYFAWKTEELEDYKKGNRLVADNIKDSAIAKRIVTIVLMVIFSTLGLCNVLGNTDWFKISVAPRVYLLEYAIKNIKK